MCGSTLQWTTYGRVSKDPRPPGLDVAPRDELLRVTIQPSVWSRPDDISWLLLPLLRRLRLSSRFSPPSLRLTCGFYVFSVSAAIVGCWVSSWGTVSLQGRASKSIVDETLHLLVQPSASFFRCPLELRESLCARETRTL
mmetsp:Transcript_14849/g.40865  ORF Transcript_14849/g.40865 Transcript_14849/m.40865 type:complete len:140 (-) Transcript_14849:67-486(-)